MQEFAHRTLNSANATSANTDRTIQLVDKFCSASELQSVSFGQNGPIVSVITIILSVIYLTMGFVIIYFIKIQERNARLGDSQATKSVIFPVFVSCLWFNSFVNMFIGVIFIADLWMYSPLTPALLFAFAFMLQHMLVEGIAIILMKKGLGWDGVRSIVPIISLWSLATGVTYFVTFFAKFSSTAIDPEKQMQWLTPYANALNFLWDIALLIFYGVLWFTPQRNLFRRPAAINYAAFWFIFRVFSIICSSLISVHHSYTNGNTSYCALEVSPYFIIAAFEPLIVYYTLLQDSRWWQGLDINQLRGRKDAEDIRSPLEGVDIGLGAAQVLANTMDFMQEEEVRLLNFAYITLDTSGKNMLGSGSFSKVYKGAYKGETCAIKLIFTVDLTADVIRRVAAEAQILSRIVHVNIVKIFGVSVLPPSVCILLEYCELGSLQDVVKGSGIFSSSGRISSSLLYSPYVVLNKPPGYKPRNTSSGSGSPWLDGSGVPMRSDGRTNISHHTSTNGSLYQREDSFSDNPHVKISTADRLWLALGCAAGIGALHEYNSNLCHRDIKSFNFLVDAQLRVKLADMELGVSDELSEKGTLRGGTYKAPSKESISAGDGKSSSRFNISTQSFTMPAVSRDGLASTTVRSNAPASGLSNIAADNTGNALSADDFLANWAAPEVVRRFGHTQASDMYSTTLVLWELLSGHVPFSLSGPDYQPVGQDEVRRRILLGERPEVPMVQGDVTTSTAMNVGSFCDTLAENDAEEDSKKPRAEAFSDGQNVRSSNANESKARERSQSAPDIEATSSPLYDGYGRQKPPPSMRVPLAHNIVSTLSPYAKYIQLLRRGWADEPEARFTARELYEELHSLWRSMCHSLVMHVHYNPNSHKSFLVDSGKYPDLEAQVAQALDCVGLSAYHTEYEHNAPRETNIGSTLAALVRSNSQTDHTSPPLARTPSTSGIFGSFTRTNSQAEKAVKTSLTEAADSKISRAKSVNASPLVSGSLKLSEAATPENFQAILACIAADPSYASLDSDGGAWVVVSTSSPHFILRTTSAFCDLLGLTGACVGSHLETVLEPAESDISPLRQFLYEMTLFNMHRDSVMRRQEFARCTSAIYPSYFCNHLLITLACATAGARMTVHDIQQSLDSEEIGIKLSLSETKKANDSSRPSTITLSSANTTTNATANTSSFHATNSKALFSVHAYPIFFGDTSQIGEKTTNKAVTYDMVPVAYALLFSEFKRIVEQSKALPETQGAFGGIMRGFTAMFKGK